MVICRENTYYDEAVRVCSPCVYICPEGTEEDCKRLCPGFGDRDRDADPIKERYTSDDVTASDSPDWLNPYVIMLIVIVVLLCVISFMAFYIVLIKRKKKRCAPNAHTVESEPLTGVAGNQSEISRNDRNSLTQDEGVGSMRSASYSSTSTNGTANGNNRPSRHTSMCLCSSNISEDASLQETKKTSII